MAEEAEISVWIREKAGDSASIYSHSRLIAPGDVFFAIRGLHTDGRKFITQVSEKGASCVVADAPVDSKAEIPIRETEGLYEKCGRIASDYYGNPSGAMFGCAVTGTNGKTTTANWISKLFNALGVKSGCIGTLGCTCAGTTLPSVSMTTPDPVTVQRLYAELRDRRCGSFAIEASSIGLDQRRLDGSSFRVGIFTNFTRDHLDYHGSMERYAEAKKKLFSWPTLEYAVINMNDPIASEFADVAIKSGKNVFSVGISDEVDLSLSASKVRHTREGLAFDLRYQGKVTEVQTRLLGEFNIENFLCATAACLIYGFEPSTLFAEAAKLVPPAGRMQPIIAEDGLLAVVDYSHTPDAIEKALGALRDIARVRGGKVWIIVGAGGDRDHGKRPLMGRAACLADKVIFTSDNPRSENPMEILRAVCAGADKSHLVIEDRREAIATAVREAAVDDIILVAGKGHEDYQEIKGIKHHFSDPEEIREAMSRFRK